jgi:CBS domain-containing protein
MQGGKHMARYENEFDEERDYYSRGGNPRREDVGYGNRSYRSRNAYDDEYQRPEYRRGRFGERADYEYNEPRYSGSREDRYDDAGFDRETRFRRAFSGPRLERSRLRCHEIMTRDLVVATRDTTLREVAIMMKEEDTGVIPVVEHDIAAGNGKTQEEKAYDTRTYNRGKLVGLITDRDIVIRAVGENHDPTTARAEEVMSTDLYTAKPHDRLVDVIRKMGDKQVRRIPVVSDSGRLLGMISMADIARETQEDRELAQALEEISQEASFWRRIFN